MKAQQHLHRLLAVAGVVGLLGTGAALHAGFGGVAHATPGMPVDGSITSGSLPLATIADVTERTIESVVNISNTRVVRADGWATLDDTTAQSKGSGVIINTSGRILTNAHVVAGADEIVVTLHDGSEVSARVVGRDPQADLAVLQLKTSVPGLRPITLGDSAKLRLGDVVLAIGDGLGVGKAVTMGIVSAKGRGGMGIEDYEDFIQTDAAINPGNSGGALINMRGELVGINTAILSKSGGYQGIGLAIPTSMARPIMDMLVKDGKVSRGYLGVGTRTVTPALASQYKLGAPRGALIDGVEPSGPAGRSGLVAGDVVVALDGAEIKTGDALRNSIAMIRPGTTVALDVVRQDNGGKKAVKIQLGERPVAPTRRR
ncbi:MAG: trypsin-like peptidase domain-containing protein [Proteobacteria bacterium]|nr:trypsin-like peptidase domain-containing protein [Pseudomonadota bacterium]